MSDVFAKALIMVHVTVMALKRNNLIILLEFQQTEYALLVKPIIGVSIKFDSLALPPLLFFRLFKLLDDLNANLVVLCCLALGPCLVGD